MLWKMSGKSVDSGMPNPYYRIPNNLLINNKNKQISKYQMDFRITEKKVHFGFKIQYEAIIGECTRDGH